MQLQPIAAAPALGIWTQPIGGGWPASYVLGTYMGNTDPPPLNGAEKSRTIGRRQLPKAPEIFLLFYKKRGGG